MLTEDKYDTRRFNRMWSVTPMFSRLELGLTSGLAGTPTRFFFNHAEVGAPRSGAPSTCSCEGSLLITFITTRVKLLIKTDKCD